MNWLDVFPLSDIWRCRRGNSKADFKDQSPQLKAGLMMGAPPPFLCKANF